MISTPSTRPGRSLIPVALAAVALGVVLAGAAPASPGGPAPAARARPAPTLVPTSAGNAAATQALVQVLRSGGPSPFKRLVGPATGHSQQASATGGIPAVLSENWAGYVDDNSTDNAYTTVSASWVQPAITCTPSEDEMAVYWVGLDGFTSPTVEQDGTLGWCFQGSAYYYTWWEMFPNAITTVGTTVAAGDHITASVKYNGTDYLLRVTDTTHPADSFTTNQACTGGQPCLNADAEWIAETPAGLRGWWPWPPFGTWQLNSASATANTGTTTTKGGITSFPANQLLVVGDDGGTLADVTGLNHSGASFAVTWTHAY